MVSSIKQVNTSRNRLVKAPAQQLYRVRAKIFRAYPKLAAEIVETEKTIDHGDKVDRKKFNQLKARLIQLNMRDFMSIGLEYLYRRKAGKQQQESIPIILRAAFPLLDLGKRAYYIGEYDLRDERDLAEIFGHFCRHFELADPRKLALNGRPRVTIALPDGTETSLRHILTRMADQVIPDTWHFLMKNGFDRPKPSNAQAFDLIMTFICCKDKTRAAVYNEFTASRKTLGRFNLDTPRYSSKFVIKYTIRAVERLFDRSLEAIVYNVRQGNPLSFLLDNR